MEREEREWRAQREAEREEELLALETTLAAHAEPSPSCTSPASPSLRGGDTPRGSTPVGTPASLRPPPSPLAVLAARLQLADLEEQPIVLPSVAGAARVGPPTPPHETQAAAQLSQMMGWDEDDGEAASDDSSGGGHVGSVGGDSDRARGATEMMHRDGTDAATRAQWEHTQRAIRQQEAEHAALQAQLKALQVAQSHRLVAMGRIVSTSSTPISIAGSPVSMISRPTTHTSRVHPQTWRAHSYNHLNGKACIDPAIKLVAWKCALPRTCWSHSTSHVYGWGGWAQLVIRTRTTHATEALARTARRGRAALCGWQRAAAASARRRQAQAVGRLEAAATAMEAAKAVALKQVTVPFIIRTCV